MSVSTKFPEYEGKTVGFWRFIRFEKRSAGFDWWEAECTLCHRIKPLVRLEWAIRGISRGCGCNNARRRQARDLEDLPPEDLAKSRYPQIKGEVFGRWAVLRFIERSAGFDFWLARCSCGIGDDKVVRAENLLSKKSQSCGCLGHERLMESRRQHGGAGIDVKASGYACWAGMVQRCTNPATASYKNYGACGIKVSDRWQGRGGFKRFLEDIGPRPSVDHTIDRFPNKDGNYEPGNVRWATIHQQARNRRNVELLTFHGQTKTLHEWCRQYGIGVVTYKARLARWGDVERSLTEPLRNNWSRRRLERLCPHCGKTIPSSVNLRASPGDLGFDGFCPSI